MPLNTIEGTSKGIQHGTLLVSKVLKFLNFEISELTFLDYLKDERRSKKKVQNFETRLFSGCSLDFLIYSRIVTLRLLEDLMMNHESSGIVVGLNPHSDNLHTFVMQSLKPETQAFKYTDGDFKSFDLSLLVIFILYMQEATCTTFLPQYRKYFTYLILLLLTPRHIFGIYEYFKIGGNPSGNPITMLFNSFLNQLIIWYCALMSGVTADDLKSKVFPVVCGDDNIIRILKDVNFGAFDMAKVCSTLGMTYTAAVKDRDLVNHTNFKDLTFLKRRFHKVGLRWRMLLLPEVIYEMIHWIRKQTGVTPEEAMQEVLRSAYIECALYGIDFAKDFYNIVEEACGLANVSSKLPLPKVVCRERSKETGYNLKISTHKVKLDSFLVMKENHRQHKYSDK